MASAEVGPTYAPEDPTLPKPWTGLIDGNTGVLYYWNPETNVTQYEKPAPVPPPALPPPSVAGQLPASTPKLAPIPTAHSQMRNDTVSQHDLVQQVPPEQPVHQMSQQQPLQLMPQQQPFQQMPQQQPLHPMPNHPHHNMNQPSQQYPHMQMNPMAHPSFSNKNDLAVPYYQGQQQYGHYQGQQPHGPPSGNNQGQNEFPMERDQMRQAGEPAGFTTLPVPQTSGVLGDHRYSATGPPIQRVGDYSVCPEEHNRLPPSTGSGGSFSELQQIRPNAVPWQQPMGGAAVTNQMGNPMSQPFIGQNTGYTGDHGRGRSEYYSSGGNEGPMMLQQQPQLTNTPRGGNQQLNMRMGAIPQPVKLGHLGGDMGQDMAMPKSHDHAAYPNVGLRGAPQKMFGSDLSIPATDSYCQHHEISVTGDNIPAPFMTFEATGFAPEILREMRYLLQRRAYVVGCAAVHSNRSVLEGCNLIVGALPVDEFGQSAPF